MASNLTRASINELIQCNKIISKVKDINLKLPFRKLQGNLKLVVYTDASLGNLTDGSSQGAYLIFLVENNGWCNLLSWHSERLKRMPRSSLAAEAIAVLDGLEATYIFLNYRKEDLKITKYQ